MNLSQLLPVALGNDHMSLYKGLNKLWQGGEKKIFASLLRNASLQSGRSGMWYHCCSQLFTASDRISLKPNPRKAKLDIVSDFTLNSLIPPLHLFAAARGVELDIACSEFDSAEMEILNPNSSLYTRDTDYILLLFSEHWLKRFLGNTLLVDHSAVNSAAEFIESLCLRIAQGSSAEILLCNFPPSSRDLLASDIYHGQKIGFSTAIKELNKRLQDLARERLNIVDISSAIFSNGGSAALSLSHYCGARVPYTSAGGIAVSRTVAQKVAALSGKLCRGLILDCDNTLWGGEVGESGISGITTGTDSPDGMSYYLLQEALRGLTDIGVLLAAASKNDPAIEDVFDQSDKIALNKNDFSCFQIHWDPKSQSVSEISSALGFGSEFFCMIDDSLFELAEVLQAHPHIDVILAQSDPLETLEALRSIGIFKPASISEADVNRKAWIEAKKESEKLSAQFDNYEEYLESIEIKLSVDSLIEENRQRVSQLFQKTNQFNLTNRRHKLAELEEMKKAGCVFGVFSYADKFGPQGVISVVVLKEDDEALLIESWLMSCRVLNRTVEEAVFKWILEQAGDRKIVGEYIPSERNSLVKDLFQKLGFSANSSDNISDSNGKSIWELTSKDKACSITYASLTT